MNLKDLIISPDATILQGIEKVLCNHKGALLVCDKDQRFLGLITDGDIRRSIMHRIPFSTPCIKIATKSPVVSVGKISSKAALSLMESTKEVILSHLPIVDEQGKIIDIVLREDLILKKSNLKAVIMVGGEGKRLHPLTDEIPKPLLPVGDQPLLERIIEQIRSVGIKHIALTTYYKKEKIKEHFSDGSSFGVDISYIDEERPFGTAGSLSMIEPSTETILVINGDILTDVNFAAMFDFHTQYVADLTVAVRRYDVKIPFGCIQTEGVFVKDIIEKPNIRHFINAGFYLLNSKICRFIPKNTYFGMDDLIKLLLKKSLTIVSFPIMEYWLDIGDFENYDKALKDYKSLKF